MKRKVFCSISLILILILSVAVSPAPIRSSAAMSRSQLQSEINRLEEESKKKEQQIKELKKKVSEQQALKAALEEQIALTQKQINLCNNEIAKINGEIKKNKEEIEAINQEIEEDKVAFRKRVRAAYMAKSGNTVQLLMTADSFSKFMELSHLAETSAARDKVLIDKLKKASEEIKAKQAENEKLLDEQVSIKKTISAKQQQLQAQSSEIQGVINSINSDASTLNQENASLEKQIKQYQKTLASMATTGGTSYVYRGEKFLWPVSGFYMISAGFMSNDSVHRGRHNGIDIAGGGIAGQPILAIADGVIVKTNNSCTHNYPGNCGCGGGFGNYVQINHGTGADGKTYVATYGHMLRTAVSSGVVKKGQVIGYVGTTGWSTGFHLHLGIAVNGVWVNPMQFYSKAN